MFSFNQLFLGFLALCLLNTFLSFYHSFRAPRCPEGTLQKSRALCLKSLFFEGERVDVSCYLTNNSKLRWWTLEGLEELQRIPLWNATGLPYGEMAAREEAAVLPLSDPGLHSVRRNLNALHAHCFLARGGRSIEEAVTEAQARGKPETGVLSVDVLHSSTALTRLMPQVKAVRRNLLSNASVDGDKGVEENDSRDDALPVFVGVPFTDKKVPVYPRDALPWAGAVFFVTAFLPPGPYLAAARHAIAVGIVPWLWHLRQVQAAELRLRNQQKQAEQQEQWSLMREAPKVPHLVPRVRIQLAVDTEMYDARHIPPLLYKELDFGKGPNPVPMERDVRYTVLRTGEGGMERSYVPPFTLDTWGMRQRYWRSLDSNTSKEDPVVPVEVSISGMIRFSVVETIKQSLTMYMQMGFTERDLDDIQDFFFRYPLHIMAIMQIIGFIQMTLTTLAFKNDITFFKGRSDYTGLSSRSLATDTVQEIIIFLYLYDYEDISRIVLFQVGTSSLINAWKFARVARLGLQWTYLLPWISYGRGIGNNKSEEATEEIDAKGMRYLKMLLYPLSVAWGVYNVYYYHYKSWWSWLVSSLADFAYTFGFINMMPQIFINYKLKSVAHMPWRVLMYKFFNTFIDDVFAFFLMSDYMTKKHRWMTLRDDVVFFIFLYQRYLYKVDPTRADEYGYVYADVAAADVGSDRVQAGAASIENAAANKSGDLEAEVDRIKHEVGDKVRVCILGGTKFQGPASEELVKQIAQKLAAASQLQAAFITGGMAGVQQTFAEHFGDGSSVWNLLPEGQASNFSQGTDLHAGADLEQRKEIFGKLGDVYLTVEGGPGVSQEARAAAQRGALVVPLIRTGGASSGMFDFPAAALQKPDFVDAADWNLLSDTSASVEDSATSAAAIVVSCIKQVVDGASSLVGGAHAAPDGDGLRQRRR